MQANRKNTMCIVLALLLPFVTCWVQWLLWSAISPFAWFLFFPTVFFSSRIGGKSSGIISTVISTLLVVYIFIPPQLSFAAKNPNNLYSVVVFLFTGVLFSFTHDRLERAKLRAAEAQEAARVANEQLQEAKIGRLQAEQKQTEACLLRSQERFLKLFSKAPVPLCHVSSDGLLSDINERFVRLFGYTTLDVPTLDQWWRLAYPDAGYRARILETWNAAVEKAAATNSDIEPIEYNITCKDDTVRAVVISGITLGDDLLATFFDVTDRKRVENALRTSEERHRTILQTAMDGFWLMDTQGRLLEINATYCRMSGYCVQELLAMRIPALVADKTADEIAARIQKIMVQGEDRFESLHRRKDGSIFNVEVSVQYRPIEGGRLVVFLRDITARKQAEEELQKKNAEIEQFIYTVSHDLRSPLVTVKTFMGYLEKDMVGCDQEHVAQDIQFIHGAADKMKLLLDELLEMSRIDHVESPPVRVSLMEVIDEVLDSLAGAIKERTAEIHLPDTDLMLSGDRTRLCQIWQNLIENAIKYSRDDSPPRIELGLQQESGETAFFVKDNGVGIDPIYHGKIFGIFEKLDPKSPGAGMGLSLIKRIIDKNGGRVWVESEGIGKGSSFYFTLPHAVAEG